MKRPASVWLVEWCDPGAARPQWRPSSDHFFRTRQLASEECVYQRGGAAVSRYRVAKYVRQP